REEGPASLTHRVSFSIPFTSPFSYLQEFTMRKVFGGCIAAAALMAAPALVSADEPKAGEGGASPLFSQLDANNDGQITSDEIPADKKRLFEHLLTSADKDKDGKLSREEFAAGLKNQRPERPLEQKQPEGPGPAGNPYNPEEMLKRLDKNGDGKITLDEVPEEAKERIGGLLKRADKNGDGAVTKEELADAFK